MRRLAALCILWLIGLMAVQAAPPSPANRFGLVEGMWYPDLTCDLGVGWERIIFDWAQHQPEKPDDWYTLNVDDRWLKAASQCGREVVALIKHTPAWATDGTAGIGVPRGLELPIDDPNNVWAAFIHKAVTYYASRGVFHYIIWNEPDIAAGTYGYEFEGSLDDYFTMVKVAYLAARQANPAARIHLAGTTYWHDVNEGRKPYFARLMQRIAQDPDAAANNYYFDAASLHIYFRTRTVYDLVQTARQAMEDAGIVGKAIWINETNAAPTDDPAWPVVRPIFPLNLQEQAAFLVQAAALALAADVERVAVYKLYDQNLPAGGESFGILNPADAAPRPAFYAWRSVVDHLSDVARASYGSVSSLDAVQAVGGDGRQITIAWATTASDALLAISATGDKAYLVDQTGNITVVYPQDGVYRLSLPATRCETSEGCFLGGETWMLIQDPGEVQLSAINGADVQAFLTFN